MNLPEQRNIRASADLEGTKTINLVVVVLGFFAGLCLGGFGVWLVYLGSIGDTTIKWLGMDLKTGSVGIAALAIGALVMFFPVYQVYRLLHRIIAQPTDGTSSSLSERLPQSATTGDGQIDEAIDRLNQIVAAQSTSSKSTPLDAGVDSALAVLFRRSAFYPKQEQEDWKSLLYVIWKTRKLVETAIDKFPSYGKKSLFHTVCKDLDQLQGYLIKNVFAMTPDQRGALEQHLGNKKVFLQYCPPITTYGPKQHKLWNAARDQVIQSLEARLKQGRILE